MTGFSWPARVRIASFSPSRRTPHADQILFPEAGELEDAAPTRDDPRFPVADDQAGIRRGVVVVHQFEKEGEAAALTGDRDVVELLEPVVVDGALLAVRADEEGH